MRDILWHFKAGMSIIQKTIITSYSTLLKVRTFSKKHRYGYNYLITIINKFVYKISNKSQEIDIDIIEKFSICQFIKENPNIHRKPDKRKLNIRIHN